jgi:trehalose 6-phosphate synthase
VLVQDYHLSLVGALLAKARPDLRTVHFSHTPFADPNVLRTLPSFAAGELLAGLAGFGACGFHTARWEAAFRASFADHELATYAGTSEAPTSFGAPLGPDPEAIVQEAKSPECAAAAEELDRVVGDRTLIVRVDRIELSKNLLRGFWAYEELLETRPRWRGRVVLLALAYPSREGLADYLAYRSEVEYTVERINERWGTAEWTPIVLVVGDDRPRSVAALMRYDVLLVNPVRDGMNLVAKEGPLVNRTDGVVVLSREAGAWEELYPAAVGINPFDVTGTAQALELALEMEPGERQIRATNLQALVRDRTAADWLDDNLRAAGTDPPA